MPRKKVPLDQRQRSVVACLPCKAAKIRCDAQTPCATCSKRGREGDCIYPDAQESSAKRRRASTLTREEASSPSKKRALAARRDDEPAAANTNGSTTEASVNDEHGPKSRMLLSSKLQKVYVGETASLSYLQFLRHVVKHRIGPCSFTEGDFNAFMLENDILNGSPDSTSTLEPHDSQSLAQVYLDATSGILDFYPNADVFTSLEGSSASIGTAAHCFILAIGAQCRGGGNADLQHASLQFSQGQQLSFQGMLCDPSLDMVQNFLHMAFYMLGACHRNAAFMYLGVAAQAAGALGLHRPDQYRHLPPEECRARIHTWHSVRVLATIVNSILGRSCSLPGMLQPYEQFPTDDEYVDVDAVLPRALALESIFKLCPFMDELETTVCKQDAATAEDFLQRLQQWSKALPAEIRAGHEPVSNPHDRERSVARLHVGSVYYFTVILVTRRFLTLYLLNEIERRTSPDQQKSRLDDRTSALAHVCLDAAVNLARIAHNAMATNQMLGNMCLLKAWIFAAGLLLGFSLFAQGPLSDAETVDAFNQSKAVLTKIAELSLQAGHYLEILSSLSDAVDLFQRRLTNERKRMTSQYLDQSFTVHGNEASNKDLATAANVSPDGVLDDQGALSSGTMDLGTSSFGLDDMITGNYGLMFSEGFPWPADDLSFDWQISGLFPT